MTGSQIDRAIIRPVTIAAAIIGSIQALAWTGLSLVAILYYNSVILIDDLPEDSYGNVIYKIFLDPKNKSGDDVIVTPFVFFIFMVVVLAANFTWLVLSLYILWAAARNKWKSGFILTAQWSSITLIIAIIDIVLMSLIAADFNTVLSNQSTVTTPEPILSTETTLIITTITTTLPEEDETTISSIVSDTTTDPSTATSSPETDTTTDETTTIASTDSSTGETTTLSTDPDTGGRLLRADTNYLNSDLEAAKHVQYAAYAIIMSTAARGYILLILNITFAIILMKFAFVIRNDRTPSLLPSDAYTTGVRPWNNLYEQTEINSYSNGGFTDENDQTAFPRSDSFITNDKEIRNFNPLSNGANPYGQQNFERNEPSPTNPNIVDDVRLAKIGKKSGNRTPPRNIPPPVIPNMPYIPDPDYTPPGSPKSKPKSVLRPKSNYVL